MTIAALRAAAAAGQASAYETRGSPDKRRQEQSFETLLATLIESRAALADLIGRAAQAGSPAEGIIAAILDIEDGGAAATAQRTGGATGPELPPRPAGTPPPSLEAAARIGDAALGPVAKSLLDPSVDRAAEAVSPRGRTVARIFNESGFFTPTAAQRATPVAPNSPSALPETPVPPPAGAGARGRTRPNPLQLPVAAPAAAPADALTARARPSNGTDGAPAYRQAPASNRPVIDHPAPRTPAPEAVAAAGPERPAGGRIKGDQRVESGKPPAPAGSSDAATANVQVTLRGGGAEASLVARVRALTPEDKARLRLEIAELLRRHGYGAATLRLNGSSEPPGRF